MDSSIIGKIDKARKYAEEKDRVTISALSVLFEGNHNTYQVDFRSGNWSCECHFFETRGVCSHIMALQRILAGMLVQKENATAAS